MPIKNLLRKFLLISLPVLVILVLAFLTYLLLTREQLCNSEICLKTATQIQNQLDETVNPCEDFQRFTCGNQFEFALQQNFSEQINSIIAEPIGKNDSDSLMLQKQFFRSCMDLHSIDRDGDQTILEIFRKLGHWPILKGAYWNGSNYNWIDFMLKCRHLGLKFDWFLEFDVNATVLQINIPSYLIPINGYHRDQYRKLLNEIAVSFGAPRNISHYEVERIIDFEHRLGLLAWKYKKESITKIPIDELQELWPSISWRDLLNHITNKRFTNYDQVAFDVLDYLKDLNKLLMGTPKRIQMDFMLWKLLESYSKFLCKQRRARFAAYRQKISRNKIIRNRTEFCLNESRIQFPHIAEGVYIRQNVDDESIYLITQIFENIRNEFMRRFDDWIVRERTENLNVIIGGTDLVFNEDQLDRYLGISGLRFSSLNPIKILKQIKLKLYEKKFKSIAENNRHFHNKIVITTLNFTIINNTMTIPANVVRESFHSQLPNYLNYGKIGVEIAQKFAKEFRNRTLIRSSRCFDEESPEIAEQIVGIDIAYSAYENQNQLPEMKMPGLKYTPKQLFWIIAGKLMCKLNGADEYLSIMPNFMKNFDCTTKRQSDGDYYGVKCDIQNLL